MLYVLVGHALGSTNRAVSNVHVTSPNARIGQIKVEDGLVELKKFIVSYTEKIIGVLSHTSQFEQHCLFSLPTLPLTKSTPLIPIKHWLSPPSCHNGPAHAYLYKYGILRIRNNTMVARDRKHFVCKLYCCLTLLNYKRLRQINRLSRVSKNVLKKI